MNYTNSPLVDCQVLSPNHSGTRTHKIDVIIPHIVVGQLGAEGIGYCFDDPSTQSSCNYGIGTDGRVCLIVPEEYRSWCSSNRAIDQRGLTIECASDKTEPYAVNDKVYSKLVDLCVDCCKRNGKTKLLWLEDKDKTLKYLDNGIKSDEMVIAVHRWFANKSCPGNYLYARLGDLAAEVTRRLGGEVSVEPTFTVCNYLMKGDKGAEVKVMQEDLIYLGYDLGEYGADGDFGGDTEEAVKEFQRDNGLDDDGLYGPLSKAALKNAVANKEDASAYNAIYRVQVGAFQNRKYAEARLVEIKSHGYADAFIKTVDGMHKVQVGAYSIKDNATKCLDGLKRLGYKDAFIA